MRARLHSSDTRLTGQFGPKQFLLLSLVLLTLLPNGVDAQSLSMLQAKGPEIVAARGQAVLLKGCNVGGWLLQESYILKTDTLDSQGRIKRGLLRVMPEAEMEKFYRDYRAGFVTKKEIALIAKQGFNCVRLPFHYDLFLTAAQRSARSKALRDPKQLDAYVQKLSAWYDGNQLFTDNKLEGFRLIDQVLAWCAANQMYVVLDLHAAPGGQGTDRNINDNFLPLDLWKRHDSKGRLIYQDITVRLWEKLSSRYRADARVGMYDLINEPHNLNAEHGLSADNAELHALYARLVAAVRTQNDQHLILLEGNGYGNEYTQLTPDQFPATSRDNLVYNAHRYWCTNSPTALDPHPNQVNLIANVAAFRDRWQVPVWVGETGENSNEWFRTARQGLEAQHIGWCHWTVKRVDGRTSLLNVAPYGSILAPQGRAALLRNIRFSRCTPNKDVLAALTQPATASTPFADLRIPGIIPLIAYDMGPADVAYHDTYVARTDYRKHDPWNEGGRYRNDGVDIDSVTDGTTRGLAVGHLATGEWMNYTLTVAQAGTYTVQLRAANAGLTAGKLLLKLADVPFAAIAVPSTGGPSTWQTFSATAVLPAGQHTVQLFVEQPVTGLAWLRFEFVATASASQKPSVAP